MGDLRKVSRPILRKEALLMYINKNEVTIKDNGEFFRDGFTLEWLDNLISFCLTPGVHQRQDGTTRSEMIRFIGDGETLITQCMEFEYSGEKGTFVGDPFWVNKKTTKLKELETRYSALKVSIARKDYYHKLGGYLIRTKEGRLEYLIDHYNGVYEISHLPLELIEEVKARLISRDYEVATKAQEMALRDLSTRAYLNVMKKEEGLLDYGYNYTQGFPWSTEGGRIRFEIFDGTNNFKSISLDYVDLTPILEGAFSLA